VTNDIIGIPFEHDVRELPRHPPVEGIMQEQVRQQRRDHPALWRPRRAVDDATILHLHGRSQPAFDVEQDPRAVGMMPNRLEHQLPVDTVKEALDVEVENPIGAEAPLAGLGHGIDRRLTRPVTVGVDVKHRLQDRLQKATNDLLGNAIANRGNTQRPRFTICLRNIDPPHRRRKVAP
jgi:hypothetical protein